MQRLICILATAVSLTLGFGTAPQAFDLAVTDRGWINYRFYDPAPVGRSYYPRRGLVIIDGNDRDWMIPHPYRRAHIARCEARYKSYDWRRDTYVRHGVTRRCEL